MAEGGLGAAIFRRAHNSGAAQEERLRRSGADDVRNGPIPANRSVLAVLAGLLKLSPLLTRDKARRRIACDDSDGRKDKRPNIGPAVWHIKIAMV